MAYTKNPTWQDYQPAHPLEATCPPSSGAS